MGEGGAPLARGHQVFCRIDGRHVTVIARKNTRTKKKKRKVRGGVENEITKELPGGASPNVAPTKERKKKRKNTIVDGNGKEGNKNKKKRFCEGEEYGKVETRQPPTTPTRSKGPSPSSSPRPSPKKRSPSSFSTPGKRRRTKNVVRAKDVQAIVSRDPAFHVALRRFIRFSKYNFSCWYVYPSTELKACIDMCKKAGTTVKTCVFQMRSGSIHLRNASSGQNPAMLLHCKLDHPVCSNCCRTCMGIVPPKGFFCRDEWLCDKEKNDLELLSMESWWPTGVVSETTSESARSATILWKNVSHAVGSRVGGFGSSPSQKNECSLQDDDENQQKHQIEETVTCGAEDDLCDFDDTASSFSAMSTSTAQTSVTRSGSVSGGVSSCKNHPYSGQDNNNNQASSSSNKQAGQSATMNLIIMGIPGGDEVQRRIRIVPIKVVLGSAFMEGVQRSAPAPYYPSTQPLPPLDLEGADDDDDEKEDTHSSPFPWREQEARINAVEITSPRVTNIVDTMVPPEFTHGAIRFDTVSTPIEQLVGSVVVSTSELQSVIRSMKKMFNSNRSNMGIDIIVKFKVTHTTVYVEEPVYIKDVSQQQPPLTTRPPIHQKSDKRDSKKKKEKGKRFIAVVVRGGGVANPKNSNKGKRGVTRADMRTGEKNDSGRKGGRSKARKAHQTIMVPSSSEPLGDDAVVVLKKDPKEDDPEEIKRLKLEAARKEKAKRARDNDPTNNPFYWDVRDRKQQKITDVITKMNKKKINETTSIDASLGLSVNGDSVTSEHNINVSKVNVVRVGNRIAHHEKDGGVENEDKVAPGTTSTEETNETNVDVVKRVSFSAFANACMAATSTVSDKMSLEFFDNLMVVVVDFPEMGTVKSFFRCVDISTSPPSPTGSCIDSSIHVVPVDEACRRGVEQEEEEEEDKCVRMDQDDAKHIVDDIMGIKDKEKIEGLLASSSSPAHTHREEDDEQQREDDDDDDDVSSSQEMVFVKVPMTREEQAAAAIECGADGDFLKPLETGNEEAQRQCTEIGDEFKGLSEPNPFERFLGSM
jgi:hypothetical protein